MPIFPIERYLAIVVNGTNKFVATPLDEASMRTIALLTADNGQNWRLCLPKNISEEKFEIINKRGRKRRNSLKEKTKNYKLIIKCAHCKWIHLSFMFCLCANAHILTIHSIEPQKPVDENACGEPFNLFCQCKCHLAGHDFWWDAPLCTKLTGLRHKPKTEGTPNYHVQTNKREESKRTIYMSKFWLPVMKENNYDVSIYSAMSWRGKNLSR